MASPSHGHQSGLVRVMCEVSSSGQGQGEGQVAPWQTRPGGKNGWGEVTLNGCGGQNPMESHFGVGAPVFFSVGMFTGGTGF